MILWKYNKITGFWNSVKKVTDENKNQWLVVFQKYEPNEHFKLSKRKPKEIL